MQEERNASVIRSGEFNQHNYINNSNVPVMSYINSVSSFLHSLKTGILPRMKHNEVVNSIYTYKIQKV